MINPTPQQADKQILKAAIPSPSTNMASTNPQANASGSPATQGIGQTLNGGQGQQTQGISDALSKATQALQDSAGKLQQAQQDQLKQGILLDVKKVLLSNPNIKDLLGAQANLNKTIGSYDTNIQGKPDVNPLAQIGVMNTDLGNLAGAATLAGGSVNLRQAGVNTTLQNIMAVQKQNIDNAKLGFDTQNSLLTALTGQAKLPGELANQGLQNKALQQQVTGTQPVSTAEKLQAASDAFSKGYLDVNSYLDIIKNPNAPIKVNTGTGGTSVPGGNIPFTPDQVKSTSLDYGIPIGSGPGHVGNNLNEFYANNPNIRALNAAQQTKQNALQNVGSILDTYKTLSKQINTGTTPEDQVKTIVKTLPWNVTAKLQLEAAAKGMSFNQYIRSFNFNDLPEGVATLIGRDNPQIASYAALRGTLGQLVKAFGDTGQLSEGDLGRALALVPDPLDTANNAQSKLAQVEDLINKARQTPAGTYQAGSSNASGGAPQVGQTFNGQQITNVQEIK